MQRVNSDVVSAPFEGGYPGYLGETCLGCGVRHRAGSRRGHVLGTDDNHAAATRCKLEQRVALTQQHEIGVEVHAHDRSPGGIIERCDETTAGKYARIEYQHIEAAICADGGFERAYDLFIRSYVTA